MTKGFVHETVVSNSVEWYTTKSVFDALGCEFDLDVCSPGLDKTWVPAQRCLTPEDNGLTSEWNDFVWCNPPYGRGIEHWIEKCRKHGNGLALVPARTDTKWFQDFAPTCDAILFMRGRIKFHAGDKYALNAGSPGVGSVFMGWGDYAAMVLRDADIPGFIAWDIQGEDL